jgi:hypothetical protein
VVRLKKNSKRGNAGPSGSVLRCFFALLLVACCLLAATPALSSDGQHSELSSTIDLDSPFAFEVRDIGVVCDLTGNDAGARLPVVLDVSAELEEPTGRLAISIECARSRHLELVFLIRPPHAWQNETNPYTALRPWLSQVDHLIEAHGEDFSGLVLDRNPEQHFRPGSYAFLVEKVGTSLRSWGSSARLIVGELGAGSGSWFGRIHASRLRPYVAGVVLNASADLGHWIPILRSKLPASAIWLAPLRQGDPETVLRGLYDAREAGVAMVMLSLDQSPLHVEVYAGLVNYLPTRFVPDPDPHPAFIDGGELQQPLAAFADTLGPQKALIFSSLGGGGTRRIHIGHHPVTNIRLVDLASGRILPKSAIRVDASSNSTEVEVATLGGPLLLSYVAVAGPRSVAQADTWRALDGLASDTQSRGACHAVAAQALSTLGISRGLFYLEQRGVGRCAHQPRGPRGARTCSGGGSRTRAAASDRVPQIGAPCRDGGACVRARQARGRCCARWPDGVAATGCRRRVAPGPRAVPRTRGAGDRAHRGAGHGAPHG